MSVPEPRAEHQILLCAARRTLDLQAVSQFRDLAQKNIDWDYLRELAFNHGLLPLLTTHAISHCPDLVPPTVLDQLRDELITNRKSNLYLLNEVAQVLSRFESAGIEALAFKGPLLAQMVYEDTGLRQAGDMDVLIHPKDFHHAAEVLSALDYKMEPQLTRAQQKSHLRFHCEIQFINEDRFRVVDLHWGITPKTFPLELPSRDFLANRRKVSFVGYSIETLTDEDLIFYLSVHAAKHCFRKLEWMTTLAELVRSNSELSWATIKERALNARAEKIVCLALMTMESLYGLPVATEFADLAESTELKDTASKILPYLLANNPEPHGLQAFRWRLRFLSPRDAYLSLARATLVPTISDWRAFSIPDALYPIYYLLRPVRLMTKYGRGAED
jgi:hypothetical protein